MSRNVQYVVGALGVITGAAIAGLGTGLGMAYGSHLFQTGQIPLPGAPQGKQAKGRRVPAGCSVKIEDKMVFDSFDGPEGTYRAVARCKGREVGQIQVSVDTERPATPRCGRNAAAQRRRHGLREPGQARTSWTGLDAAQRRTGLGTKMYEVAQAEAYRMGVPLVPDACGSDAYGDRGETSEDAWRVWQRRLGWKGRTSKRRRR